MNAETGARFEGAWRRSGLGDHFVYTLHDENDALLYVGLTQRLRERIKAHFERQPWAAEIHRVSAECGLTEIQARAREARLIDRHKPRYNIQGSRIQKARDYRRRPIEPGHRSVTDIARAWGCRRQHAQLAARRGWVPGAHKDASNVWQIPQDAAMPGELRDYLSGIR